MDASRTAAQVRKSGLLGALTTYGFRDWYRRCVERAPASAVACMGASLAPIPEVQTAFECALLECRSGPECYCLKADLPDDTRAC
jgi:hypothetical protein